MTNFDYLKKEKQFDSFVDIAIIAEKTYSIDTSTCIMNCRRAMEMAIKWMYSVDEDLKMPYQDNLRTLMSTDAFHDIVDQTLWNRLNFIRQYGNQAVHTSMQKRENVAKMCLRNLFYFMDFIACCYAENYEEKKFDDSLLDAQKEEQVPTVQEVDLETLIKENEALKEELSKRRQNQQNEYVPKPLDLSEFNTRRLYIDAMLIDAGWVEGRDWINEVELKGMPNSSEVGYADYVLFDDNHMPLAVIEAKRTCVDVSKGRQQAKLYADLLEKKYRVRPVTFLTNGFETRIIDNQYPERRVSSFYSKRDLQKLFNLRQMKSNLNYIVVDQNIAGRYYQEQAIKEVCHAFDQRNRRKALLVMATGSGKTRTVIGLVDVLLKNGWIKNILFLADRNSLVTQAKRSFVNMLPELSATNLCEDKKNTQAHAVFSTYQTMMGCIDSVKENDQKVFTCGHFDLIICDEAHRSIYNKYKDIFTYFDAPLVGLTATPKDEIDKNTYDIFELEKGVPTYGYDLSQAVKDGYLVDFLSIETDLKFMNEGIEWDELSEEEKEEFEETFIDEDGNLPTRIQPTALNEWVFNEDTIKKVLHIVFEHGIHIDFGQKIGKTIIFAKNHDHAEYIYKIFNKEYPELEGYAKVIDNYINYAQSAIDEFSDPSKLPQIAISVDMLDTGIDVPEVVNLVFFKKVMSKAKFWQMIGRGTRLCEGLIDGEDKKEFYIFDFCGNFEFFRMNKEKVSSNVLAIQGAIFNYKFQIVYKLQELDYQTEELQEWRKTLVNELVQKVQELDRNKFDVRQHLRYVDQFSNEEGYITLTEEDLYNVKKELAPLILPDDDEISAIRFDALLYGIELANLTQKKYSKGKSDLLNKVKKIASVSNIPEIQAKSNLIDTILHTDYLDTCGVHGFEKIREELRDLMKYLPKSVGLIYETNFEDDIISTTWHESDLENDELENYKAKIEYYIMQHQVETEVIHKLKTNQPLNKEDLKQLQSILWDELGTKQEYVTEYGDKPLGEFVRELIGLDMNSAKEAFSEYLNSAELNANQIYFVNQIVEYIVRNGVMKDLSVLQESPFTNKGSVFDLFSDDMDTWSGIRGIINNINQNALT